MNRDRAVTLDVSLVLQTLQQSLDGPVLRFGRVGIELLANLREPSCDRRCQSRSMTANSALAKGGRFTVSSLGSCASGTTSSRTSTTG